MALLDRNALLTKAVVKIEQVILSEAEHVFVKEMTGRERDRFEQSLVEEVGKGSDIDYKRNLKDFRAKLAVCTLCNEKGELLLKFEDYELLSKNISASKLEKIVNAAQKINKISEEDKSNLVKNS